MTAILDISFLFALTDKSDRNHQRVLAVAQNTNEVLVLPIVVLPEICYLIASRLGHQAMRHFVSSLTTKAVRVESVTARIWYECMRFWSTMQIASLILQMQQLLRLLKG